MGIGVDVKDAYSESGIRVHNRRTGNSGESIDFEANAQVTKPFIREFFLEGSLPYDTDQIVGDIMDFIVVNTDYMFMNKTPIVFENEVYEFSGVYYKCNVSGEILRPSGEVRDTDTYELKEKFNLIESNVYALQTEPLFGTELNTDEMLGVLQIEKDELYIPSSYNIQVLDRYQPVSGEYYKVNKVLKRRYNGIDVCTLEEDNR